MPFCTQCAHENPAGARFCAACGAPIPQAEPVGAAAGPPQRTARPAAPASTPTSVSSAETVASDSSPSPSGLHGRFEPGTRLGTRYRIVALLGRGGMGEVYRADDLELGQSVALKFLPAGVAANPAELARFRSEVRVARLIAHPNVCRVYDIGEADGHVFLSMEYIDGEDLASVLRRMGRPTPDKAIEIARQICLGLAAAHEAGMLHRDLKPANVMIDGRGRARITDFGLAGLIDELKRGTEVAGTPAYMAPEQLADGRVSVRSDVYSLGLVLYELFTGKRVFEAKSIAELRQQQDSGSITTPTDLARGIDPAVDRVIMHCLERDPDARPASAYAVLGALPGGDPLAAALAAGETPSPELVANAGDRGGMSPLVAVLCVVAGLAGLAVNAAIIGPEFRPLTQPAPVLSVRADDLLLKTGSFGALPRYSVEAFDQNKAQLKFLREQHTRGGTYPSTIFFWRRWSPRKIDATSIHQEVAKLNDPPMIAPGEAAVLLDPAGRLIGLRAIPPDTMRAANGGTPAWSMLWSAAGLDSARLAPAALVRPVPATCDTAAAWATTLPWNQGEKVTLQAGASRGRLVHFTIVHDWGTTTAAVDSLGADPNAGADWGGMVFVIIPLFASVYFAVRNLRLGRGDLRGATRIAVFVFLMNMLEAVFSTRLTEVGLIGVGLDLFTERGFGHSAMHAIEVWFAYIALEPYVRRLWPRMLVSWTRLVSGRPRDPLVGRDLLIGSTAGMVLTAMLIGLGSLLDRIGLAKVPTQIGTVYLASVVSLPMTATGLAYSASVCVLNALPAVVLMVAMRLVFRRTWAAVAVTYTVFAAFQVFGIGPEFGWPYAVTTGLIGAVPVLILMRFGLLPAITTAFVLLVLGYLVATLDLSAWYADRALLPGVLLVALLVYGAATALTGRSILGDPLREGAGR